MMFVDSIVLMIDTLLPLFLVQVYFAKINKVTVSSLNYVLPSLLISVSLGLFCYPFLANAFTTGAALLEPDLHVINIASSF